VSKSAKVVLGPPGISEVGRRPDSSLAKSLEDLRTAQDRFVQTEKLASLGQLTAGIAHEIKNAQAAGRTRA
jgi:C4-dicarboxylate-specific signal transduction histidine kinase